MAKRASRKFTEIKTKEDEKPILYFKEICLDGGCPSYQITIVGEQPKSYIGWCGRLHIFIAG